MKQDRFLLSILAFIGVLVVVAVVLFFIRSETPAYGPEDRPQDVLHNYAVALQLRDYERAYNYLLVVDNRPTLETFRQTFLTHQLDNSNSALQIGEVQTQANGEAWVSVTVQYAGSGPFDQGWSSSDTARLVQKNGKWMIAYLPYPYWSMDWYQPTPVKQ